MDTPVTLRPLTAADAPAMAEVLADPALYEFTGGEPPTADELASRYARQVRGVSPDGTQRWLNSVVELDARPVGYVQATIPVGGTDAEIAWVIGTPWQGRGVARAAARQWLELLRAEGVRTVVGHIHPGHVASQRVATAMGLRPTGEVVDGEERWSAELA